MSSPVRRTWARSENMNKQKRVEMPGRPKERF